jgi:hypothetical protein
MQADDVPAVIGVHQRQRVAISHIHDVTRERGCARGAGECR